MSEPMTPQTPRPSRLLPPAARVAGRARPARRPSRLGGQDGFVLVAVLALLTIGLALGAVAVAESLDSRTITSQDQRTRRAQQATDAGIQSQLYQQSEQNIDTTLSLNSGPLNLSTALICKIPAQNVATGQLTGGLVDAAVNSAGACPGSANGGTPTSTIPVQALGNHTYDQSEFIPGASAQGGGSLFPKIVSLGWDDNGGSGNAVYSRQLAVLAPIAPLRTLEAQGNLTITGLSALGLGASTVYGNISAAGSLSMPTVTVISNLDNIANGPLGTATYGSGAAPPCVCVPAPTKSSTPVLRQPITVASTKASCPDVADTCSGITTTIGSVGGYNAANDTFSLSSGNATFAPGDYVLCSFHATGGTVTAQPTAAAPVRIFIDSPSSARCNSGTTNAALNQYNDMADPYRGNFIAANGVVNGGIAGLGGLVASSGLQIYVVGDRNTVNPYDNGTTVTIGTDCVAVLCASNTVTQSMIVYAPTSAVSMYTGSCALLHLICTGGVFEGALIGDTVTAQALTFLENLGIGNYPLYNGVSVFHPLQFVQCSSQPFKTVSGVITSYTRLQADPAIDTNGC
jgi:hypothetical protein